MDPKRINGGPHQRDVELQPFVFSLDTRDNPVSFGGHLVLVETPQHPPQMACLQCNEAVLFALCIFWHAFCRSFANQTHHGMS